MPEVFLRAINLQLDAEHPERIRHFQPTSKTVPLVRSLMAEQGEGAYLVVAPYGSGKSITASYILQLVEGRAGAAETLEEIEERLEAVSPELAASAGDRRQGGAHGITLALHGHHASVPEAIQQAALASMKRQKLGREARSLESLPTQDLSDVVSILERLREKAEQAGRDRIVILWDEFGRHVESLIAEGRSADLAEIQVLAEYASRSEDIPVTLALLLHRDLLQYAGNLPQSVRAEWKKIEGRFQTIQYVDDSREIYRLIAEIVTSRRNGSAVKVSKARVAAKEAKKVGLFAGLTEKELTETLRAAYPLEPATLYLLPRLSARVAQNERTLFSFLVSADLTRPVGPDEIFDYFSGEMRSDVAAGGTYRQWLETESALAKSQDELETKSLKAACLLSLGLGGERSRTGRRALVTAVAGYGPSEPSERVIDELVDRKLLLHRKHSDQVAVWHGTDFDLRGRLEEEKRRRAASFDLVCFLKGEVPAPFWRPLQYNDDYCLRRYFSSEYRTLGELDDLVRVQAAGSALPVGCDGRIVYVLGDDAAQLREARERLESDLEEPRLLVALPRESVALTEAALEVACLLELQGDRELLGADPMVEPELHQMLDDARDHLQRLVDRLVLPGAEGPRWFHRGQELELSDKRSLRATLSRIMKEVFPKTPRINNEMIVKERPSSVLVNARKRLELGILERADHEDFGIEGNGPDASMMRTVLVGTGLFREEDGGRWAAPEEIDDPGLREVWETIGDFLTTPSARSKPIASLVEHLRQPPYGVRQGVLPILFAAGLKAFPSARALLKDGRYVEDILASDVEAMLKEPHRHELVVQRLGKAEKRYLRGFYELFTREEPRDSVGSDIVRKCFDALSIWASERPPGAFSTHRVSETAEAFRKALEGASNPLSLFLETIPDVVDEPLDKPAKLLSAIREIRDELEAVEGLYRKEAERALREALRLGCGGEQTLQEAVGQWANCFPGPFIQALPTGVAKGLLTRFSMPYPNDDKLLDSIASLLIGKGYSRWDDATAVAFERGLRGVMHEIEDKAMALDSTFLGGGEATEAIAELVQGRIERLVEQLTELVGKERAEGMVRSALRISKERESA